MIKRRMDYDEDYIIAQEAPVLWEAGYLEAQRRCQYLLRTEPGFLVLQAR